MPVGAGFRSRPTARSRARSIAIVCTLLLPTAARTAAREPPLDLSDAVIRQAIADTRDPMDDVRPVSHAAFGASGPPGPRAIDRRFREAEIPTCLTPAAFLFDPPTIGPVALGGLLALPFWMHAIATGRCRT